MSILRAEGLHKRFKVRDVVKGISFGLESGEIVGLLGPNGAGKTTAFYMLVGLIRCDRGRILLDDRDLGRVADMLAAAAAGGYRQADILETLLTMGEVSKRVTAMCADAMDAAGNERIRAIFESMRLTTKGCAQ